MSKNAKVPLEIALRYANTLVSKLEPYCERIEVLGSIRRKKEMVGDAEILVIPKFDQANIFGYNNAGDSNQLARFLLATGVELIKNGDLYKKFKYGKIMVDLFFSNVPEWGIKKVLRTGAAEFSKLMVTRKCFGGYMPNNYRVKDSQVWMDGTKLNTPEEEDVFMLWGMRYWEPEERL